jgi:hypothetical protein
MHFYDALNQQVKKSLAKKGKKLYLVRVERQNIQYIVRLLKTASHKLVAKF